MNYRVGFYYGDLCPFETLASFCTLRGTYSLKNKEFALRYAIEGKDVYSRYKEFKTRKALVDYCVLHDLRPPQGLKVPLVFADPDALRQRCVDKRPANVHVGGIYPGVDRAVERKSPAIVKYAPLVFDVDMEDFLRQPHIIRSCGCPDRRICDTCYTDILQPAAKTLVQFLHTMGFRAVLLVYSGRRGFHCYVLDRAVWDWTSEQRAALLARVPPSVHLDQGVTKDPMHMCKLPLMPHQATGVIACPIMDVDVFRPSTHTFTVYHLTQEQNSTWARQQVDAWARHIDDCIHFALQ